MVLSPLELHYFLVATPNFGCRNLVGRKEVVWDSITIRLTAFEYLPLSFNFKHVLYSFISKESATIPSGTAYNSFEEQCHPEVKEGSSIQSLPT
jgi:hypothetical protein